MLKMTIAIDTWHPHNNDIANFWKSFSTYASKIGIQLDLITSAEHLHSTIPYLNIDYPVQIEDIGNRIDKFNPDIIHIVTEGPIGNHVKKHCLKKKYKFTTSLNINYAKYLNKKLFLPKTIIQKYALKWHKKSSNIFVFNKEDKYLLENYGYNNHSFISPPINKKQYNPNLKKALKTKQKSIFCPIEECEIKDIKKLLELSEKYYIIVSSQNEVKEKTKEQYKNVKWIENINDTTKNTYLASADIVIQPQNFSLLNLSYIKAKACGTPCILINDESASDIDEIIGKTLTDFDQESEIKKVNSWNNTLLKFISRMKPINDERSKSFNNFLSSKTKKN